MSSPISGKPRFWNLSRQPASLARNTGMQLMKAQPAASACSAYQREAASEPTGRYDTTISAPAARNVLATLSGGAGDSSMTSRRYCPIPSWVGPRRTSTPVGRRSAKRIVLVGGGLAAVAARQELAKIFQYRVGGSGEVGVDPLHVAQDIEMERAGLDTLDAAGADACEMRLGRTRLHVAKDFLLVQQPARRARILGHEHRRGRL